MVCLVSFTICLYMVQGKFLYHVCIWSIIVIPQSIINSLILYLHLIFILVIGALDSFSVHIPGAYMCMYHMHCVCVLRQASHEYQIYAGTGEVVLTIMMSRQLLNLTGFYFACFKSCVPFLLVYNQVSVH